MNVTLWDTSSDVRKELSVQDDRTESDNRIEVTLFIGIAENNLPHIARWESTKPPYAEPHVRWCGRSVNVKIGGKCLLWLAFTSYPIFSSRGSFSSPLGFFSLNIVLSRRFGFPFGRRFPIHRWRRFFLVDYFSHRFHGFIQIFSGYILFSIISLFRRFWPVGLEGLCRFL